MQAWQASRPRNRVGSSGTADHQARRGQDALAVRDLDRLIDLWRQPEIVGGDDQPVQWRTSRRSRRKAKNSTPSRSRRFSICGLFAISETMAAIFGARK